jgi:predicted DNA-binding transcriptional regulator YafY
MKVFEQINRMKRIHKMIESESTGSPEFFASVLSISKRQLFNIIEEMKLMGAPIRYDKLRNTYYYQCDYEIRLEFEFQLLSDDEKMNINGGNFLKCNFISSVPDNFVAS